jgi:hypothetical protein
MKFFDVDIERHAARLLRRDPTFNLGLSATETKLLLNASRDWVNSGRHYVKLWPSIAPSAVRFLSDCESAAKLPEPQQKSVYAIRFPESDSISFGHSSPPIAISTAVVMFYPKAMLDGEQEPLIAFAIDGYYLTHNDPRRPARGLVLGVIGWNESVQTLMGRDPYSDRAVDSDDSPTGKPATEWLTRTGISAALFVSLVERDPDIVEPVLLARDEHKREDATPEQLAVMVARAARRGENGIHIGRSLETMPHYRRPHHALRWTGPGRTIPRIVWIKPTIVHRDVATRVPTGHYAADGRTEIEPKS